jgi:arylsulfatase A-like enzyme
METVDDDTMAAAINFIKRARGRRQALVRVVERHPHALPHPRQRRAHGLVQGAVSGRRRVHRGMVEHDMHIGQFLKVLDELGIADNTIVFYSTDNGPHYNTWPDAAATPFRGEKNTNWEGGWRVPAAVRWPGKIAAGSVTNEIVHHMDWLPTFVAAAGDPDIKDQTQARFRVHRPLLQGPPGRLQHPAPAHRRDRREPARGDLLLLRRRRPHRPALRNDWKI